VETADLRRLFTFVHFKNADISQGKLNSYAAQGKANSYAGGYPETKSKHAKGNFAF